MRKTNFVFNYNIHFIWWSVVLEDQTKIESFYPAPPNNQKVYPQFLLLYQTFPLLHTIRMVNIILPNYLLVMLLTAVTI